MLNRAGKTSPIAASSFTSVVPRSSSTSHTVASPVRAAPSTGNGEEMSPARKKPPTIPSRMLWLRRHPRSSPGGLGSTKSTPRSNPGYRSFTSAALT